MTNFYTKAKDQISISVANLTGALVNGLFWLYLASTLDKSQYGEVGYLISIAELGFSFANFGIVALITVYGAKGEKIFFPAYEFGLISSVVLSVTIYLITQNIAISLLVIGTMMWSLLQAEFNSKKKYSKWSIFHILRKILTVVLSLIFLEIFGLNGIVLGLFIATLPSIIGIKNFLKSERKSLATLRPKLLFMGSFYLSSLTTNLFWWGDKVIIGTLFNFSVLGNYQLAGQFFGILYTIPVSLMIYLIPQEAQGIKNNKFKKIAFFVIVGATLISILILPFFINIFFPKYIEIIFVAQVMLLGIIPAAISNIIESKFLGNEKSKLILYSNASQTGVYFVLLALLGTSFGLIGFSISFVIALTVRMILNIIFSKRMKNY